MGYGFTLVIVLVLLALIGVTRWDLLRARLAAWFAPPPVGEEPAIERKAPHPPRHLHDDQLQHQAPQHKPAIHRSGRRD